MSASGQEDMEHKDYEIPEWMRTDDSTERADIHMRRNVIRDLSSESRDSVLMTTRMLIKPECLHECHPSYAKALHALLISKGVQIPNPSESGMNFLLGKFLFPTIFETPPCPQSSQRTNSGSNPTSPLNQQSAHSDSAQPTGPLRSESKPHGPGTDGSTGFQPQNNPVAPKRSPDVQETDMQSQALSLDAARREYVALQQAIRNMPQNYNPLPVPGSTANTVPPAPDSRTSRCH